MAGASSRRAVFNVLLVAFVASALLLAWVTLDLGGWAYYGTPLRVRGYEPLHKALRPTGYIAHPLGVIGLTLLLMPVLYAVRKKWKKLKNLGSMPAWLNAHIFCGIVGPIAVTLHSSFKFNGIVSIAYWSMMAVMLSGFVGRYWYVRIPQTIRGTEMTLGDIQERLATLKKELDSATLQSGLLERVHQVEREATTVSEGRPLWSFGVKRTLRRLKRDLREAGVERGLIGGILAAIEEEAWLVRRIGRLNQTKRLFAMWYVFHRPLVYVMFAVAIIHVSVALYMGYRWW